MRLGGGKNLKSPEYHSIAENGYLSYNGLKIYEDDALKQKYLVTSSQTAFSVDFLVDLTGQVDISSVAFEAVAKQYNRFHLKKLPFYVMDRREELSKESLTDAYFQYIYLEICQRYEIQNYQVIKGGLDQSILRNREELMKLFRIRHCTHSNGKACEDDGCISRLVIDAGLKPHRKVCKVSMNLLFFSS